MIRAFRPHAAEVVALVGDERYPLQHIDSGLFAVALPFVDLIDYRLEVSYERRRTAHRRRRLPLPAHPGRGRPAPVRRGSPRTAVGGPRRAPPFLHHRRRRGRRGVLRGVGAQRQRRQPDRRVQRLGRQRGADAGAGLIRRVGAVLARLPPRRPVQVPGARRRRIGHRPRRPDGVRHRGAAADRLAGHREQLPLGRRRRG